MTAAARPGRGRLRAAAAAVLAAATALSLTSCSDDQAGEDLGENTGHPAYVVSSPLETTNAASLTGASTNAELISGRVYPAVYTPGPNGQMIPNTDLASTQLLPGAKRKVLYDIAPDASFSDGHTVTCDDFYLAVAAGKLDRLFGAQLPWTDQVESVQCRPGAKRFQLSLVEGAGTRWRQLFGPGEILPAHAIVQRAGVAEQDLVPLLDAALPGAGGSGTQGASGADAAQAAAGATGAEGAEGAAATEISDAAVPDALREVARVWRDGFRLSEFDEGLQLGYGPYRVDSVGEHGEVRLVRNEHYHGAPAEEPTLVVWPPSVDTHALAAQADVVAADITRTDGSFIDRDNPGNRYEIHPEVGYLTETLLLGEGGVFATPEDRDAFNACVDQKDVAAESSRVSGVEVPAVAMHVLNPTDPDAAHVAEVSDVHLGTDQALAGRLKGKTVRIGYMGPDPRKAAMVESIRRSCEPAGITVEDVSETTGQLGDLIGVAPAGEDRVDAVLKAVDPVAEYSALAPGQRGWRALQAAEAGEWRRVRAIPLASQPRVFATDREMGNVNVYTGLAGIGWNMDRWRIG